MAISNLNLNVTTNTARALADFNKFSRSLDNKFLVSGLKLDVVRSALGQINRDFQRAIGEQGLASASSLRAAQNQAALLTQTFKGFSSESALAITQNIGTALNNVAVKAGGTFKDVQKTLAATPFISTMLAEDVRIKISKDILDVQKNFRRAGIGDNFGGIAQQFLTGGMTGMQLLQTGGAMESFLGSEIIKRAGGSGMVYDPKARSELLAEIVSDPDIQKQLREMAKQASGFKIILEDLNTQLFNTESGVFGALKKVIDRTGKSTTMFDEVYALVDQVFGPKGMFRAIFQSIKEIFKIGDPMRPFIDAIQFVTGIFNDLTNYFRSDQFKGILFIVKDTFYRIREVFTGIYEQVKGGGFSADEITAGIRGIGESIRGYIKRFGEMIRGEDVSKEAGFVGDIAGTLLEEIGKTSVVLIKELFMTLIDKVPEIVTGILPAINRGINGVLTEAFGEVGAKIVKFIAGFIPGPIGMIARASAVGDVTGGGGSVGSMLAMGAAAALTPGSVLAARNFGQSRLASARQHMGQYALPFRYGYGRAIGASFPLNPQLGRTQYGSAIGPNQFVPGAPGFGGYRFPTDPMMGPYTELGRISARTSVLGGTMPYDIPSSRLFQNRLGQINSATSMFNTLGFNPGGVINRQTTMFQPPTARELFPNIATGRPRTGMYNFPTEGPMAPRRPEMFPSAYSRFRGSFERDNYDGLFDERLSRTPNQRTIDRFNRRYGVRGRMAAAGRGIHRVGMGGGYLMAGVLASEVAGQAVGGAGGEILSGLGQGAATGAQLGMLLGPKGIAIGAVVGGIIGGAAPLLDKGVRDGVGKFMTGINQGFANTVDWFVRGTQDNWTKTMDSLKSAGTWLMNGMIGVFNNILSGFQIVPKLIMGMIRSAYENVPGLKIIPGLGDAITAGESVANFQLPTMYGGKDYAGPSLALEARMSGRRPMVVNDGEFVIPKDGFSTLAGLVGENLRTTGVSQSAPGAPVQVSLSLTLNVNSVVANPDELASALREPVYKIVGDAWAEAVNATRTQRTRT
jgi:hypothetical protein